MLKFLVRDILSVSLELEGILRLIFCKYKRFKRICQEFFRVVFLVKSIFSRRFFDLRKLHKLTQKEAAQGMGLREISVRQYEKERRQPTFEALIKIADFFNVSADYLLGRSNSTERLP